MPITLRLGLYYATIFAGTGVSLSYIAVWFRAQGLNGAQIGAILSAPMLARVLTGPALGLWADGFRLRRTPMALLGAAAAAGYAALGFMHGFWAWFVAWFVGATAIAALTPLADVVANRRARLDGFVYGLPRGVGSTAYVLANLTMGLLLTRWPPQIVLWWIVVLAVLTIAAARVLLPPDPVHDGARVGGRDRLRGLGGLLRDRTFLLAAVSAGLIQAGHAFYYGFSTLIWKAQGLSAALIGMLWAVGVAAEVAFMWFMEPWRRRLGPARLLALGGLGAVVRWTALGLSPPVALLVPLQGLHMFSFTSTYMASLQMMERLAPPQSASAAQTFSSALSTGLLIGIATLASGPLFDAVGAAGYFAMAATAGCGLAGALILVRRPASELA